MIDIMTTQKMFRLDGTNILVTGASSGLGCACALACAEAGARLIISGRNIDRLNELKKLLEDRDHLVVPADLTVEAELRQLADQCPVLDGVIHSAGIHGVSPMRLAQRSLLTSVFETNYFSPIFLTQRLLQKKKINPNGSILFISSIAAKAGKVGVGPYSGSKAALLGTLRPFALELAKHGIRANALCPGIVKTPLFSGQNDWLNSEVEKTYPLGLGQPEDIGNTAVFFLSEAARAITGTAFSIDGGVPFV